MTWKRDKQQEEPTVRFWFENVDVEGEATASLVNNPEDPDAEIRISYGKDFERITVPVSKSLYDKMTEKEFLRIVNLHLKRHGVVIR